ncbi:hypothetical protein [Streptomyces goshikiensis]
MSPFLGRDAEGFVERRPAPLVALRVGGGLLALLPLGGGPLLRRAEPLGGFLVPGRDLIEDVVGLGSELRQGFDVETLDGLAGSLGTAVDLGKSARYRAGVLGELSRGKVASFDLDT